MGRYLDLIGRRFGKLTVVSELEMIGRTRILLCKCECGNVKKFSFPNLFHAKGCGCLVRGNTFRRKDLSGKRFGRLTVIDLSSSENGILHWRCVCDCGNEKITTATSLSEGHVQSCGCLQRESRIKHGYTGTSEHTAYVNMIRRCYDPKIPEYRNYGARGIIVCDRWLGENGFKNFISDMGDKPTPKHSLDRYPNNTTGNYEPSNCRWATFPQQQRNKRTNRWISFNGKTLILADWAREFGITRNNLGGQLEYNDFEYVASRYIAQQNLKIHNKIFIQ